MFSRAAKSVVNNFGQRNYHAGKISIKNTRALVLAAERSRVPGIRTTLVEQTAEKPVLNSATTSEQNGLVAFTTEKNSLNEKTQHSVTNEEVTLTLESVSAEAQETPNTCESSLPQGLKLPESEAGELLGIINKLPAKEEPITDANRQLRSYPVSNFSQHLGISKQLKTPGADMCSQYQDITYTPKAKPESDFFSSTTPPGEFTLLGGGSERRRESGRNTRTNLDRSLLSVLVSGCNISRRCYGKCGDGSKSPKSPSQPDCPKPKKMPVCPSPSTPPTQPCPPEKVKFRECPPPPKLPKLPKCPPPCAPPPAPPVPECPAIPKCPPPCPPPKNSPKCPTSSPCPPPKKKCSGRQMSTYGLIQRDYEYAAQDGIVFRKRCPVFLVARRRFSSSSVNFASKSKSDKNCDSNMLKSYKEGKEAGKKSATDRCARSKSKKRDTKGARECRKSRAVEKCSTDCAPKPRCPPPIPPPPSKPQVEWLPPICSTPKLVRPSACPESSKQAEPGNPEPSRAKCPPPPPLPKPPCRPVCLCPCPPPPKLPPGSCPDVPSVDAPTESSCLPPCPPKTLPPCPEDTWCPSKPICPSKK